MLGLTPPWLLRRSYCCCTHLDFEARLAKVVTQLLSDLGAEEAAELKGGATGLVGARRGAHELSLHVIEEGELAVDVSNVLHAQAHCIPNVELEAARTQAVRAIGGVSGDREGWYVLCCVVRL